jgi:ribosomal protein L12E/L44/L45/RPP1/RPP2
MRALVAARKPKEAVATATAVEAGAAEKKEEPKEEKEEKRSSSGKRVTDRIVQKRG